MGEIKIQLGEFIQVIELGFAWEGWIARLMEIVAKTYAFQGNTFEKIF